ncbi:MAG TPA: phosphatase PAP2 family protein [Thermoleophilaceae bacterium]|nr:phosphatase PAP2 family protein [Actinomycetota bacterium]HYN52794.1 phosphatase PAP2 family protein [Thermoleophilaceae bacterium]
MLAALDRKLLRFLRTRGHWPELERAALLYARTGENGLLWHAMGALGALLHRRRRAVYLRAMRVTLFTLMANTLVKMLVRRARPVLEELPALSPTLYGRSYPSAHASTSFAAAGALSPALPRVPLYAGATVMALTRPYLGVHYPSDVVAGAVFGRAMDRLL